MSKLLPRYGKVIVRPAPQQTRTESGLEVVRRKEEFPEQGEVVAVARNIEDVTEGDSVLFRAGAGAKIRHEDEDVLVVPVEELHAVLEP